jgi:Tfp pilus assembly protein PilO
MLEQLTKHIPARMIPLLMIAIIGLTLTVSYIYQFKGPWKNYKEWQLTLNTLRQAQKNVTPLDTDIHLMQQQMSELDKELNGDGPKLPANQMVAYVIGKLDEIAEQHDVHLDGVRPGNISKVLMFNETPYHIVIKGTYINLFEWLYDVESKLGPLVIKEYKIEPMSRDAMRRMQLTMVSYRSQET